MEDPENNELISKITDIRQSDEWAQYMEATGWSAHRLNSHGLWGYSKKLPLTPWSMLKVQRSKEMWDWEMWKRLKKDQKLIYSIYEPWLESASLDWKSEGFRATKNVYISAVTRLIDLCAPESVLWSRMSENARRLVRRNEDLEVREVGSDEWWSEWQKWAKSWIIPKHNWGELARIQDSKMRLIWGVRGGLVESGLALITCGETLNYYQTFTTDAGRGSGSHYTLVWREIQRAQALGLQVFDLEGVDDDLRSRKAWRGFSEFKKRLGGQLIRLPDARERWW
jgi:hypothetical protein